jgi:hypothetical protein
MLNIEGLRVDPRLLQVERDGVAVRLCRTQFLTFCCLALIYPQCAARQELLALLPEKPATSDVGNLIHNMARNLEPLGLGARAAEHGRKPGNYALWRLVDLAAEKAGRAGL